MPTRASTRFYLARIVHVDPKTHRAKVELQHDEGSLVEDVELGTSYANPESGQGDFTLPEEGAQCLVAFPGDTSSPTVVTYLMPTEYNNGATGGRPELEPGDKYIASTEGGYIISRANGIIEIGSTPLSSTMMIPVGNLMQTTFENLKVWSTLGAIDWVGDENASGLKMGIANKAGGYHTVTIKAGTIPNSLHPPMQNIPDTPAMRLEIMVNDDNGGEKFGLRVSTDGKTSLKTANVGHAVTGSYIVELTEYFKVNAKGQIVLRSKQDVVIDGTGVSIGPDDASTVALKAKRAITISAPKTEVGNGSITTKAVRLDKLAKALTPVLTFIDAMAGTTSVKDILTSGSDVLVLKEKTPPV